ncbi:MBL fold metallo-hydrolase [Afifella pfennigii]|uniref:MBL fold metallo-hydrolase n=1 Tax=Afifella pfennigii TaxID=209897 RepID=UPI00047D474E|nr:MBL fold metallo-hydrolase [Afifella pfennigii]
MSASFASTSDVAEKTISFEEIGPGCFAFTAEGDPNSGVIVGDDAVMVVDAQATPRLAEKVIERIRSVTDKPIRYVTLSHYHAVRVLGASAFGDAEIIASDVTRDLIVERGQQDWESEFGRFPRLFKGHESIPGLTWPSITFVTTLSVWLGKREVRLMRLGRAHTEGDIVAWVPDAQVMFSGDIVEYRSACYCGDAHLKDWPETLARIADFDAKALVPGRGAALTGERVKEGVALTHDFLTTLFQSVKTAAAGGASLKQAYAAARAAMDGRFGDYAIYEHCMPFNVARAYDEAKGMERPQIWTAERDRQMWAALEG